MIDEIDNNESSNSFYIPGVEESRVISQSMSNIPVSMDEIITSIIERIRAASTRGEYEIEVKVEPGYDWRVLDVLGHAGYDVRREERGVLSISWA